MDQEENGETASLIRQYHNNNAKQIRIIYTCIVYFGPPPEKEAK